MSGPDEKLMYPSRADVDAAVPEFCDTAFYMCCYRTAVKACKEKTLPEAKRSGPLLHCSRYCASPRPGASAVSSARNARTCAREPPNLFKPGKLPFHYNTASLRNSPSLATIELNSTRWTLTVPGRLATRIILLVVVERRPDQMTPADRMKSSYKELEIATELVPQYVVGRFSS